MIVQLALLQRSVILEAPPAGPCLYPHLNSIIEWNSRELTAKRSQMGRKSRWRGLWKLRNSIPSDPKAVADSSATTFGDGFCCEFTIHGEHATHGYPA